MCCGIRTHEQIAYHAVNTATDMYYNVGFLWVLRFTPTIEGQAVKLICDSKLPVDVNVSILPNDDWNRLQPPRDP